MDFDLSGISEKLAVVFPIFSYIIYIFNKMFDTFSDYMDNP